jgi:hypothetical protein
MGEDFSAKKSSAEVQDSSLVDRLENDVNGNDHALPHYDAGETARILHKIDYRLIPILALLYLLSFLDKGNIGNAKIAGMSKDLHLTGTQYNIALTVCRDWADERLPRSVYLTYSSCSSYRMLSSKFQATSS